MRRAIAAAAILGLAACGGTAPVNDPAATGMVRERFQAWVHAFNDHALAELEPFYSHHDYLTFAWPNGERTRGWQREADYQRTFLPSVTLMNLVPRDPVIVLARKNLAVISFAFSLSLTAGENAQVGPGQGIMVWQEEDGAWRIIAAQRSYTRVAEARVPERR